MLLETEPNMLSGLVTSPQQRVIFLSIFLFRVILLCISHFTFTIYLDVFPHYAAPYSDSYKKHDLILSILFDLDRYTNIEMF